MSGRRGGRRGRREWRGRGSGGRGGGGISLEGGRHRGRIWWSEQVVGISAVAAAHMPWRHTQGMSEGCLGSTKDRRRKKQIKGREPRKAPEKGRSQLTVSPGACTLMRVIRGRSSRGIHTICNTHAHAVNERDSVAPAGINTDQMRSITSELRITSISIYRRRGTVRLPAASLSPPTN
jgi:hypothetical protein